MSGRVVDFILGVSLTTEVALVSGSIVRASVLSHDAYKKVAFAGGALVFGVALTCMVVQLVVSCFRNTQYRWSSSFDAARISPIGWVLVTVASVGLFVLGVTLYKATGSFVEASWIGWLGMVVLSIAVAVHWKGNDTVSEFTRH